MNVVLVCRIGGMLRAVGRVIRACQEERLIRTSVTKPKFNILHNIHFAGIRVAANQAAHQSAAAGVFSYFFKILLPCYLFFMCSVVNY
jgi:hypothetical protein